MKIPVWRKGTAVLAVTLVAGVVIGVAYERRHYAVVSMSPMDAHDTMRQLHDNLGLDSAQQQAIAAIFARRQGAVDSAWHRMQPELRSALDSTHREILKVLRPDQVAKFAKMIGAMHH
jgi:Spy/CpxP family protein refolding chaperone